MVLGIDLGTTYSVCAYIDDNGEAQTIVNSEGAKITPSVVYFESDSSVVVGQAAKENSVTYPDDVISAVKNDMGTKKKYISTYGVEYSPEAVSGFILKKLINDANKALMPEEPIRKAVITIPAYFTDAQRTATEDAARIAGIELVGTINEPTAAALYYAVKSKLEHANILIYDLGGGTFDVTVITIDGSDIRVKSTGGLSRVGGRFFDEELVGYICGVIDEKYDIDLEDEEYIDIYQELFTKVEKAKMQLSSREKAAVSVRTGSFRENIEITRAQFEEIVAKLYKRTEFKVNNALRDAGLTAADLDKVILVGGSSRIPYIEKNLRGLLGKEPSHEVNPDEVVALGAAIYAEQLTGTGSGKTIRDVCSHSIGFVTFDPGINSQVNSIVIKRNSPLPIEASAPFRTIVDGQKEIELSITEGEFRELSDVTVIAVKRVPLPQGLKAQTRGNFRLKLDTSQLVHAFIEIPSMDYVNEFEFQRTSNLSEQDVAMYTGVIADYDVI